MNFSAPHSKFFADVNTATCAVVRSNKNKPFIEGQSRRINMKGKVNPPLENEFGETPLPYAPVVSVSDGRSVVPQQFLDVNRTLSSVEAILGRIKTPDNFVLFAGEENDLVYLMCGAVGHENYIKHEQQRTELKIVYGRRWLLEPSTPTSEVVQTAALAVKKTREHELRERVVLRVDVDSSDKLRRTTPFNCHMDLPLMVEQIAQHDTAKHSPYDWSVEQVLSRLTVDNLQPTLHATTDLSQGRKLYDIRLTNVGKAAHNFADLESTTFSVLCVQGTRAEFLHALFDALLAMSDQYVDETISFEKFTRFSRSICPLSIAQFSYQTRNPVDQDPRFGSHFQDMSYRVDAAKAPAINQRELGDRQRQVLSELEQQHGSLAGHLPHGYAAVTVRQKNGG